MGSVGGGGQLDGGRVGHESYSLPSPSFNRNNKSPPFVVPILLLMPNGPRTLL